MRPAPPLTGAETIAVTATSCAAITIITAYLLDRAGGAFTPLTLFPIAVSGSVAVFAWLRRRTDWSRRDELAGYAGLVFAALLWLVWQSRPWYLPLGHGPDITHHLLLIDYIERHWHLVHDPAVEPYLGEMVHYTPGVHILAAVAGGWLRSDGLHLLHQVVSASVALKIGFVYLIALRVLSDGVPRVPLALTSAVLLLVPRAYVLDSFMYDSFLAQVVSEGFAVAMWWALTVWDEVPAAAMVAIFSVLGAAAFLTWPVWVGPPGVAFGLALLFRRRPGLLARIGYGLVAAGPLAVVAALYIAGRTGWIQIARTSGAVLHPLAHEYGVWFLAAAAAGTVVAAAMPRARTTLFLLLGIGLQAGVLYLQARTDGNDSAYMAFKTFYLAPYPLAVLAVLPAAAAWRRFRLPTEPLTARAAAWVLLAVMSYGIVRPAVNARRETPTISEPLFEAGVWARDHLPPGCVAYMVNNDATAYWLHLGMLRNRRMSPRSADNGTYNLGETVMRWYSPQGLPYAIADLPVLTRDVRSDLEILAQFDTAAVVKRRGAAERTIDCR